MTKRARFQGARVFFQVWQLEEEEIFIKGLESLPEDKTPASVRASLVNSAKLLRRNNTKSTPTPLGNGRGGVTPVPTNLFYEACIPLIPKPGKTLQEKEKKNADQCIVFISTNVFNKTVANRILVLKGRVCFPTH